MLSKITQNRRQLRNTIIDGLDSHPKTVNLCPHGQALGCEQSA
jgi:hypothetical protein